MIQMLNTSHSQLSGDRDERSSEPTTAPPTTTGCAQCCLGGAQCLWGQVVGVVDKVRNDGETATNNPWCREEHVLHFRQSWDGSDALRACKAGMTQAAAW
eukprot:1152547-Amphidinium_carterae.1